MSHYNTSEAVSGNGSLCLLACIARVEKPFGTTKQTMRCDEVYHNCDARPAHQEMSSLIPPEKKKFTIFDQPK